MANTNNNNDTSDATFIKQQTNNVTTVILGFLMALLIASISWIGYQASHVPEIKAVLSTEISYINTNLVNVGATLKETNKNLKECELTNLKSHADITRMFANHNHEIDELKEECEENQQRCHNHLTDPKIHLGNSHK